MEVYWGKIFSQSVTISLNSTVSYKVDGFMWNLTEQPFIGRRMDNSLKVDPCSGLNGIPLNSCLPRTSGFDLIWKWDLYRYNEGKEQDEIILD